MNGENTRSTGNQTCSWWLNQLIGCLRNLSTAWSKKMNKRNHSLISLLNSERSRVFIEYYWSDNSLHSKSRAFPNTKTPPKSTCKNLLVTRASHANALKRTKKKVRYTRRCIASASSYLPCRLSTEQRWLTLVRVSECSSPRTLSRTPFTTRTSSKVVIWGY